MMVPGHRSRRIHQWRADQFGVESCPPGKLRFSLRKSLPTRLIVFTMPGKIGECISFWRMLPPPVHDAARAMP